MSIDEALPWARPGTVFETAPDGSEIRPLLRTQRASMVHCTLPSGASSGAVRHATIEEFWYCISGAGEMWRELRGAASVIALAPGVAVAIPPGAAFQFRAADGAALVIVICTVPPWPGDQEAQSVADHWPRPGPVISPGR